MFSKLVGNDHVKQTLRRLIEHERVPNSLLFAGPDGVGKRQFALELARTFVCTDKEHAQACGVCAACRRAQVFVFPTSEKGEDYDRVFFSEHPDIGTVIPFRRNVRINAIRELEREANFRPYEAQARFFIVDDAEKMADPAANALLKTLEEPPSTSYIFLITSRADSLLPTIRSRCQTLRFAPVAAEEIETFLVNDRAFTSDEARLASRLARGSIGRALSIDVKEFRGVRDQMVEVVKSAIATHDIAAMLRASETTADPKKKDSFEAALETLDSLIHDVWTLAISGEAAKLVNTDLERELRGLADSARPSELGDWLSDIQILRENLAVNINRRVATDALFTSMAA